MREYQSSDFAAVEEIFWLTSSRSSFLDSADRLRFRQQYLDVYLNQMAWVACEDNVVVGYIVATNDTLGMHAQWPAHLELFRDQYQSYPAHLHINCHPRVQGRGWGKVLLRALEQALVQQAVKGLHLITSASARNVSFYLREGYQRREQRTWGNAELLLLAKSL